MARLYIGNAALESIRSRESVRAELFPIGDRSRSLEEALVADEADAPHVVPLSRRLERNRLIVPASAAVKVDVDQRGRIELRRGFFQTFLHCREHLRSPCEWSLIESPVAQRRDSIECGMHGAPRVATLYTTRVGHGFDISANERIIAASRV